MQMNGICERKHVVVVSSEPRVLAEIKMELMDNFEVSIAASSDAVLFVLETIPTAAILVYIGENHEESFQLYEGISEAAKHNAIPVIFLAERGNDEDETRAFELGAVDYTVRRKATLNALNSRINLRIHASQIILRKQDMEDQEIANHMIEDKIILIVDDVKLNRDLIESMLMDVRGLVLEFAENGQDAYLRFVEEPERYSMIIMDIQMPVLRGDEAARLIRSYDHARARVIPIVALTADTADVETAKYFSSGMDDYLPKPMDYAQLINMVTEYCF